MSTLNVSNITDGTTTVGTSYVVNGSAKAWVCWVGTGTVSIRNSLNTSSITDNTTGDYAVNYSTSFSANTYSYCVTPELTYSGSSVLATYDISGKTASATQAKSYTASGGTNVDCEELSSSTFGDLA
jgi:hypothetical protein